MKKRKIRERLFNIFLVIVFLIGLGIFLYPTVSDIYGKYRDSKLMAKYSSSVKKLSTDKKQEEFDRAVKYNELLKNTNRYVVSGAQYPKKLYSSEEEMENYNSLLKTSSNGIMGILDIPGIAVSLPLYHWSTDEVLDKGIGHIHGSSLPVGCGKAPGEEGFDEISGSHCVLIGHRGLPSSKLFSDLDEMKVGDMFYIKVFGQTLAYKVYEVEIVLPTEVENLKIEDGRDLVTLITCTPYGVNTHRILVKAERVAYDGEKTTAGTMEVIKHTIEPKFIAGLLVMAFALFMLYLDKRNRKTNRKKSGLQNKENGDNVHEEESN